MFANLRDEIEKLMEEDGRTGTAHLVDALMSLAWPQAAVPSPAPEAVREIVRRLREPVYTEETMRRWDSWRVYIAKGGGGSWPRDAFEALLDAVDIERGEAADLLLSLRQVADYEREVAEAEIAGRKAAEASLKTAIRLLRDINEDTAVPWIHEEITAFLAAWKARYE